MGTSLTGLTPATTYDALIKVGDNGPLSATAKVLSDGLGNDSPLAMSTTNVGVGTSSPLALLHISQASANTNVRIGNNSAYDQFIYFNGGNDFSLGMDASNSNAFVLSNASTLGINDRLVVTTAGNVGIGTSSPAYKLDINGGFADGANNYVATFHSSTGSSGDAFVGIGAYRSDGLGNGRNAYINAIAPAGGTGHLGLQISGGNVGIGTTTPYTSLTIGTSDATAEISSGGSNTHLTLKTVGASGALRVFTIGGGTNTLATTETMRITSDGYLRMASGTGGIQFNGDTAAANALDDYEEGTWTPTYTQDGTPNTATYATRSGTYTKIGNLVTVFFDIDASSLTAGSGNCRVDGLPFTVSNSMAGFSFVSFRDPSVFVGTATDVTFIGFAQKGSNYIMCRNISTTTGSESAQTSFAGSGRVTGMVQYTA